MEEEEGWFGQLKYSLTKKHFTYVVLTFYYVLLVVN